MAVVGMRRQGAQPLQEWICDVCDEPITGADQGIVRWTTSGDDLQYSDFQIIHKTFLSDPEPYSCDPHNGSWRLIEDFLNADGLALLLSWLSIGPLKGGGAACRIASFDDFVELVRRVQTPFYEEARRHFDDEQTRDWLDDANEYSPYLPATLQRIAEGSLGSSEV
jgi:hypothetical protein